MAAQSAKERERYIYIKRAGDTCAELLDRTDPPLATLLERWKTLAGPIPLQTHTCQTPSPNTTPLPHEAAHDLTHRPSLRGGGRRGAPPAGGAAGRAGPAPAAAAGSFPPAARRADLRRA